MMQTEQANTEIQYDEIDDKEVREWIEKVIMKDEYYDLWDENDK
jgi:hypothetical protein